MPTRAEWQALLEQQLVDRPSRMARNQAITLCCANWYLQEPWLFKWAGLAAFASAQVGTALAVADLAEAPHGLMRPTDAPVKDGELFSLGVAVYGQGLNLLLSIPMALHDAATRQLQLHDLELVRQANDAIFNDIGWAHLAYMTHGIRALGEATEADDQPTLLAAFRLLDKGAYLMRDPEEYQAGARLIKQAALDMLYHEQMTILPPFLERMSSFGQMLASFGSWLDFEGRLGSQASFGGYFGPLAVLLGSRSISKTEDRWAWIEGNVLDIWAELDEAYCEASPLHRRLVALANATPTALQQTAGLLERAYPALALKL